MPLKQVSYKDSDGRSKVVLLPEQEPEEYAELRGIPVGPPNLEELGLPQEIEIRLSNELFNRRILTARDAIVRRSEVQAALQAALKLNTERIVVIYAGKDYRSHAAQEPTEVKPNKTIRNRRPRKSR